MEENKMRIVCDPYHETIDYFWLNENGNWKDLSNDKSSAFNKHELKKGNISHNGHLIIDTLIDERFIDPDGSFVIEFEGTDDNYYDFEATCNAYYSKYGIQIKKGNKSLKNAYEIKPEIDTVFYSLQKQELFSKYENEEINKLINKYSETVKHEIAICVIGLYSCGKSTFINSLIGTEILQSSSDAETAKIYKIKNAKKERISFNYIGEQYTITIASRGLSINPKNTNDEFGLLSEIKESHKYNSPKCKSDAVYCILKTISAFIKKSKAEGKDDHIGNIIEIDIPFINSYLSSDFEYVIYDTPGSDSASNSCHFEILNKSLKEQTNGLPIIVSTPDTMDKTSLKELFESTDNYGKALDLSNTIIVINKSDDIGQDDLKNKKLNVGKTIISENNTNNIYFVSSVVGLGGKKLISGTENNWINGEYHEKYYMLNQKFSDSKHPFYTQLYKYNILPRDVFDLTPEKVKSAKSNETVVWNSGVPSVELGIARFSEKFALYNKCVQAIDYLNKSIIILDGQVQQKKQDVNSLQEKKQDSFDSKKQQLLKELKKKKDDKIEEVVNKFVNDLHRVLGDSFRTEEKKQERLNKIKKIHQSCKGKNDYEKSEEFKSSVKKALKDEYNLYYKELKKTSDESWKKYSNELSESLLKYVTESEYLTEEEKKIVSTNMKLEFKNIKTKFETHNAGFVENEGKKFLWIHRDHINDYIAANKYNEKLQEAIRLLNNSNIVKSEESWEKFGGELYSKCENAICLLNPELMSLQEDLKKCKSQINVFEKQLSLIEDAACRVNALLKFEEV